MIKLKNKSIAIATIKYTIYSNVIGSYMNTLCANVMFCNFYIGSYFTEKYD